MNRLAPPLAALALAACTTAPAPLAPPEADVRPVTARDNLDGSWTIANVNGTSHLGMTLVLAETSLRVGLACNGGGGTVTRNGDKLFLDRLALTERACEPSLMRIDEQVGAVLREGVSMEYTPPARLRLLSGSGTIDLVRTGDAK